MLPVLRKLLRRPNKLKDISSLYIEFLFAVLNNTDLTAACNQCNANEYKLKYTILGYIYMANTLLYSRYTYTTRNMNIVVLFMMNLVPTSALIHYSYFLNSNNVHLNHVFLCLMWQYYFPNQLLLLLA